MGKAKVLSEPPRALFRAATTRQAAAAVGGAFESRDEPSSSSIVSLLPICTPAGLSWWRRWRRDEARSEQQLRLLLRSADCELRDFVTQRQSCQLPERHYLETDSAKLVRLKGMLQEFKRNGSKCIIFTQFSKMLDVLESFVSFNRFTYVRLDGTVHVERRQQLVDRFNLDERIFLFIASTRA